jgi:hypothetical protein
MGRQPSDKRLLNGLEEGIQRFAKRKMKGGYRGEQAAFFLQICSDHFATVSSTILLETEVRIEILARVDGANWSLAFVCKKAKLGRSALWTATGAEILGISGVTLDNVEDVVTWLELP